MSHAASSTQSKLPAPTSPSLLMDPKQAALIRINAVNRDNASTGLSIHYLYSSSHLSIHIVCVNTHPLH